MKWVVIGIGIGVCAIIILSIFAAAVMAQYQSDKFFRENPNIKEILDKRNRK